MYPIRVGAPAFCDSRDPEILAQAHRDQGYRAAYCPGWLTVDDGSAIDALRSAFSRADVVLAEVGAWGHILHPDEQVARANREHATQRLALADAVGARCCVDYTGSQGPGWFHQDNLTQATFDAIVEITRGIVDAVEPTRTVFAIEMMPTVHPENPDDYLRLLAAIDRPGQVGVHLDPVNLINSVPRYYDTTTVIRECFEKLGPHIASCHGKDVIAGPGFIVHLDECRPGSGVLDYRTFLRELAKLPQQPPLMLEHLPSQEEYHLARDYVFAVAQEIGVVV
jgi:sugar phosphate isomerase/epimerase